MYPPLVTRWLIWGGILFEFSTAICRGFGVPPPAPRPDLPGKSEVKIKSYWLAPHVRASEGLMGSTVTWLTRDGHTKRQTVVNGIEPGFVTIAGSQGQVETILGVNEDWKIDLPPEPTNTDFHYSVSGYITSTPDSRVFVHEFHPKAGMISLDIYIHGTRANKVGPYFQHLGNDVSLNDDGSASLPIWTDEFKTNEQIVNLDTNGMVTAVAARAGPELDLGPNPVCAGRVPGTQKALFWTGIGFETNRYHLIDADGGKEIWNIPCPGGQPLAVGLTPRFIIVSTAELYGPGAHGADLDGFFSIAKGIGFAHFTRSTLTTGGPWHAGRKNTPVDTVIRIMVIFSG